MEQSRETSKSFVRAFLAYVDHEYGTYLVEHYWGDCNVVDDETLEKLMKEFEEKNG